MKMGNDLSENLIKTSRDSAEESPDVQMEQIRRMIRKEKSQLFQMKIITASLWLLSLLALLMQSRLNEPVMVSDENITSIQLYLYMCSRWLPSVAFVSTLFLLFRLWGSPRKEANLRLMLIERRIDQLDKADLNKNRE